MSFVSMIETARLKIKSSAILQPKNNSCYQNKKGEI